jgi:hypothetical protein
MKVDELIAKARLVDFVIFVEGFLVEWRVVLLGLFNV